MRSWIGKRNETRSVLGSPDHARFLLMVRKIRRDRRNYSILALVLSIIAAFIVQQYWYDLIIGGLIWALIGIAFALTVIRYYNAQEAQVLWQIEQIARGSSQRN